MELSEKKDTTTTKQWVDANFIHSGVEKSRKDSQSTSHELQNNDTNQDNISCEEEARNVTQIIDAGHGSHVEETMVKEKELVILRSTQANQEDVGSKRGKNLKGGDKDSSPGFKVVTEVQDLLNKAGGVFSFANGTLVPVCLDKTGGNLFPVQTDSQHGGRESNDQDNLNDDGSVVKGDNVKTEQEDASISDGSSIIKKKGGALITREQSEELQHNKLIAIDASPDQQVVQARNKAKSLRVATSYKNCMAGEDESSSDSDHEIEQLYEDDHVGEIQPQLALEGSKFPDEQNLTPIKKLDVLKHKFDATEGEQEQEEDSTAKNFEHVARQEDLSPKKFSRRNKKPKEVEAPTRSSIRLLSKSTGLNG